MLADSSALARRSLSSPASMIPDSVPVRNVAMGIINSKNLLSTGLMPFIGCVTKIRLYSTTKTIPKSVSPSTIPIKNFNLALSSSVVYLGPSHISLIICILLEQAQALAAMLHHLFFLFHSVLGLLDRYHWHYSRVFDILSFPSCQGLDKDIYSFPDILPSSS